MHLATGGAKKILDEVRKNGGSGRDEKLIVRFM